jgi:hypothetical protein
MGSLSTSTRSIILCVYPALLITKATGTLDNTSTSSGGGGERLEKDEKVIDSVTGTQARLYR